MYGDSTSVFPFFKLFRAGTRSGGDPHDDYASSVAKYYPTVNIYDNGEIGENSVKGFFRAASGEISGDGGVEPGESAFGNTPAGTQPVIDMSADWVAVEVTAQLNTISGSDGTLFISTNGFQQLSLTAISDMRTDIDEDLSFVQPITHLEGAGTAYDWAMSRMYIDVGADSRAHVFLSNSATASGVTQKFVLPASAWATGALTVTDAENIPSGYDYVYVVNSGGEINSSGYAYTVISCP